MVRFGMNAELKKAKDRAAQAWSDSVLAAGKNMAPFISVEYSIVQWSNSVSELYRDQWCGEERHSDAGWDWEEIYRRYKSRPKNCLAAMICDGRLSCLALFTATRQTVSVAFLEGDPREDCKMKPFRATIMLDLAATYGQRLGCNEIRLEPVNDRLTKLYEDDYGFERVTPKKGETYVRRSL